MFTLGRYKALMRCIRFDWPRERKKVGGVFADRFTHIREVWDIFNRNLQHVVQPTRFLTVDEILLGFRGRVAFKQYIPTKASKYGLKIFLIVDVETQMCHGAIVYLGKYHEKNPAFASFGEQVTRKILLYVVR